MAILTFENIMEAADITEEAVSVPEWGGEVVVKSLSYRRMGKIKALVAQKQGVSADDIADDDDEFEKAIIVAGMVNPAVTDEQAEMLMEKSAKAVIKVLGAIMGSSNGGEDALKSEEKSVPSES